MNSQLFTVLKQYSGVSLSYTNCECSINCTFITRKIYTGTLHIKMNSNPTYPSELAYPVFCNGNNILGCHILTITLKCSIFTSVGTKNYTSLHHIKEQYQYHML